MAYGVAKGAIDQIQEALGSARMMPDTSFPVGQSPLFMRYGVLLIVASKSLEMANATIRVGPVLREERWHYTYVQGGLWHRAPIVKSPA